MNLTPQGYRSPTLELAELRHAVENARWRLEREQLSHLVVFGRLMQAVGGSEQPKLLGLFGKSPVGTPLISALEEKAAAVAYWVWRERLLEGRSVTPALLWVEALRVCKELRL